MISDRSCGASFGATAPDSSLVMSRRLAMKRLSRSDSSMIVAEKLDLLAVGQLVGEIAQRAGRTEHRSERRFQVMGNRGQQRRAQPLGFGGALDAIHVLDQLHALDGERALIHQRVEQPPLIGREQRPRSCRCRCRQRRWRRVRYASAGTGAWRPAACPSRGRRHDRFPNVHFAAARSASSSVSSGG